MAWWTPSPGEATVAQDLPVLHVGDAMLDARGLLVRRVELAHPQVGPPVRRHSSTRPPNRRRFLTIGALPPRASWPGTSSAAWRTRLRPRLRTRRHRDRRVGSDRRLPLGDRGALCVSSAAAISHDSRVWRLGRVLADGVEPAA